MNTSSALLLSLTKVPLLLRHRRRRQLPVQSNHNVHKCTRIRKQPVRHTHTHTCTVTPVISALILFMLSASYRRNMDAGGEQGSDVLPLLRSLISLDTRFIMAAELLAAYTHTNTHTHGCNTSRILSPNMRDMNVYAYANEPVAVCVCLCMCVTPKHTCRLLCQCVEGAVIRPRRSRVKRVQLTATQQLCVLLLQCYSRQLGAGQRQLLRAAVSCGCGWL